MNEASWLLKFGVQRLNSPFRNRCAQSRHSFLLLLLQNLRYIGGASQGRHMGQVLGTHLRFVRRDAHLPCHAAARTSLERKSQQERIHRASHMRFRTYYVLVLRYSAGGGYAESVSTGYKVQ